VAVIEYRVGDILEADVEALVNTVNCVGVMGRGIALQFKSAFPSNFKAYAVACKQGDVQPGRMFVFERGRLESPRFIINFPTKRHWRGPSRLSDIETGIDALVHEIKARGIQSVAIPPLGAGLGGLNWADVRAAIAARLSELADVRVVVFEPSARDESAPRSQRVPAMTPGRAALVGLMGRYIAGLLDPSITLLEVHKLMYFMQEAGEPLRLHYVKAHYGPYAENLRHVLKAIEGHFVVSAAGSGDEPDREITLVPGAVEDARRFLVGQPSTRERFDRVASLVDGFETPYGLELLATVHWLAAHESVAGGAALTASVHAWNDRKKQFTDRQLQIAFTRLVENGWIEHAA
jgi:O-acetyl-ADP-ribose deacetylase (regulator of RNase III)